MNNHPATGHTSAVDRAVAGVGRIVALVAVTALTLGGLALTFLAIGVGAQATYDAFRELSRGEASSSTLKVEFIGFASLVLQATALFVIAVGLFSLFVRPLAVLGALQARSLQELEHKVLGIIVVILATAFVEQFIKSNDALETLYFALSLGISVAALAGFQLVLTRFGGKESK